MNTLVSGLFSAAESYGKTNAAFEIILMLLISFLLGYLFHYFLSKKARENGYREKYEALSGKFKKLESDYVECCSENEILKKESRGKISETMVRGIAKIPEKPQQNDDLKVVEGIGPKIERLLNDAGIFSWKQLAETDVEKLELILKEAGPRYRMHNPGSWPLQAKMAAEGKWKELEKWQSEHKHGRI